MYSGDTMEWYGVIKNIESPLIPIILKYIELYMGSKSFYEKVSSIATSVYLYSIAVAGTNDKPFEIWPPNDLPSFLTSREVLESIEGTAMVHLNIINEYIGSEMKLSPALVLYTSPVQCLVAARNHIDDVEAGYKLLLSLAEKFEARITPTLAVLSADGKRKYRLFSGTGYRGDIVEFAEILARHNMEIVTQTPDLIYAVKKIGNAAVTLVWSYASWNPHGKGVVSIGLEVERQTPVEPILREVRFKKWSPAGA